MSILDQFIDSQLVRGRSFFSREEVRAALEIKPQTLTAALTRLIKKQHLANPRRDFYLILRPEDRVSGAPDPARWIDGLMRHQGVDYRISLLRAAAFHGSSHQAAMVFQIIVPQQLREIVIGRHRIQFVYQSPGVFTSSNLPLNMDQFKTATGFAKVAGPELTLLDCMRYFHHVGGINGVAQIVKDIGGKASPRHLNQLASVFDTATVRRLGYLLELFGCERQSKALVHQAKNTKTALALDPSVKPMKTLQSELCEKNAMWNLIINEIVETDF